jgi:hypothetical protein
MLVTVTIMSRRETSMSSCCNWQLVVPPRTTALFIPEDIYRCIFAYIINGDADRSLISALTRVCKCFAVILMQLLGIRMAALLWVTFPLLASIDFLMQDNLGWTWRLQPHREKWISSADESSRKSMRGILENKRRWFWKSEIDFEAAFVGVFYMEKISSNQHNDLVNVSSPPKLPRTF